MFSQLRGIDSTGVGLVYDSQRKPEVLKTVGGFECLTIDFDKRFNQNDWEIEDTNLLGVISHHRKATIGKINEEKAHPFHYDNIIGCHNGTVFKHNLKHLDSHDDELIDSEIILQELDKQRKAAPVLKDVYGAWALTWWDMEDKTLHMCRNKERELYIAWSKDEETLFWASEDWMLHQALRRCNYPYDGSVAKIREDRHVVFKFDKKNGSVRRKVILQSSEDAPGKRWAAATKTGGNTGSANTSWPPRGNGGEIVPLDQKRNEKGRKEKRSNVKGSKEIFEEEYTDGFGNTFISKRRFLFLTSDGCSCCGKTISWAKRKGVAWLDEKSPLCSECKDSFSDEIEAAKVKVH